MNYSFTALPRNGASGPFAFFAAVLMLVTSVVAAERVAWTTSHVKGSPDPPLPYRVERVFGDSSFDRPVTFTDAPGTDSMFLLELPGRIYELPSENSGDARLLVDLKDHIPAIQDVYGLAFHPKFQENREIYVAYIRRGDSATGTVLSRFRLSKSEPLVLEKDSEQILLTWLSGGHNGGCVKFGPDGYLYISAGDASAPFPPDPLKAGQDITNLLSSIFRIDVDKRDGELPYAIPDDNPFVDIAGARGEIWAYGFRNPWRMAFDQRTGDLWVGDVGWELWEMIHHVRRGGNYGWSIVEGPHTVHADGERGPTPITKAVAEHSHSEARSITGGQVYYGDRLPDLNGYYIYGDHATGIIWALRRNGESYTSPQVIARTPLHVICFGVHPNGELYIVDYGGSIYRLIPNESEDLQYSFPRTLGESGLYTVAKDHELAPGVLPYSIVAESWMDGATAERFVAVPENGQIGVYGRVSAQEIWNGQQRGAWKFPKNSVVGKTISLGDRRVETQLLHYDGQTWQPYTYIWSEDQTDAQLADNVSRTIDIDVGQSKRQWQVSNRTECMVCHSSAVGMLIGFKPEQLHCDMASETASESASTTDQLEYFDQLGLFEKSPRSRRQMVNPHDQSASFEDRARSYLHINCSHCHRREGGGAVPMDVRFEPPLDDTRIIDERPTQGTFGIESPAVVMPGDPFRSVLYYRFTKLGPGHMPHLGATDVDPAGARLLFDWITSLGDQDPVSESAVTTCVESLRSVAGSSEAEFVGFLSQTNNGMMIARAIDIGLVESPLKDKIMGVGSKLPEQTRGLFERYMPAELRTKRLGNSIDPQVVLAQPGDRERGRSLFLSESISCKTCHAIEPDQKSVGPNLATLADTQYTREVLLQNLLNPSAKIAPEYMTHVIETVDGEVFSGILKSDAETIVLVDAQNKEHRIDRQDVEFRKSLTTSIMPDGLLNTTTLQQAADLLEFLLSLRAK